MEEFTINTEKQIKYTELPQFSEVMAAGTAAALVPIRSISRRFDPASSASISSAVKQHPRLSTEGQLEKVAYIPPSQEDAGPICIKLLTQLKGIQLGKVKDELNWCAPVTEADTQKASGAPKATNGNGQTVDQMD